MAEQEDESAEMSNTLSERLEKMIKIASAATPGPWEIHDSCSWRRIGTREHDGNVLCPTKHPSDGHPDLTCGRHERLDFNLAHIAQSHPAVFAALCRVAGAADLIRDHVIAVIPDGPDRYEFLMAIDALSDALGVDGDDEGDGAKRLSADTDAQ